MTCTFFDTRWLDDAIGLQCSMEYDPSDDEGRERSVDGGLDFSFWKFSALKIVAVNPVFMHILYISGVYAPFGLPTWHSYSSNLNPL